MIIREEEHERVENSGSLANYTENDKMKIKRKLSTDV
jgi:hypothetical protein